MLAKHSTWIERHTGLNRTVQAIIATLIAVAVFISVYQALAVTKNEIQSVVQIAIFDDQNELFATGSGTLINDDGDILTNYHVLEPAITKQGFSVLVLLTIDPKRPPVPGIRVKLRGYSEIFDLGLLTITEIQKKDGSYTDFKEYLTANKLGVNHVKLDRFATEENVNLGDEVQILGYPGAGGSNITLTKGTVSGFQALKVEKQDLAWLIKTDAKLNPGNSGGAAFDAANNFIGVPTAVAGGQGNIGYIVSLPVIDYFLDKLLGPPAGTPSTDGGGGKTATCQDLVNGFLGDDGVCYCNPGYAWGDAENRCIPSKTPPEGGITIIPAQLDDAYCEANVRKNSVFNPASGNCECKEDYVNMDNECVPRSYFTGTPLTRADLLNCKIVADIKTKRYWLRGHVAIKTMSLKNKTCPAKEEDAKAAKYRKQ